MCSGADIDAVDEGGRTPLHDAILRGEVSSLRVLARHGANVSAKWRFGGGTPLHTACLKGRTTVARFLLDQGADVDATDATEGKRVPLNVTTDYETIRALLDEGAGGSL